MKRIISKISAALLALGIICSSFFGCEFVDGLLEGLGGGEKPDSSPFKIGIKNPAGGPFGSVKIKIFKV